MTLQINPLPLNVCLAERLEYLFFTLFVVLYVGKHREPGSIVETKTETMRVFGL